MTIPKADGLGIPALEDVYDRLAEAIDRVGEAKAKLLLVKLALLNANALGDADVFRSHLEAASLDL
ncbi:MAG TPA: DUF2783 domain-containing protein [Ramlibacter sp.]|nr:DUF2783 domain-containing protein [Ramlibacter sp.]